MPRSLPTVVAGLLTEAVATTGFLALKPVHLGHRRVTSGEPELGGPPRVGYTRTRGIREAELALTEQGYA